MLKPFEKKQKISIDCQEAYNLWDALKSRYDAIQLTQVFHNFMHDVDFKFLIKKSYLELMEKQVTKLENEMNSFQLILPERPPKSVRSPSNSEVFEDKFIASRLLSVIQDNITQHLRFIRTSITNDNVRQIFTKFLKEEIGLYDKAVKYIKQKGWLGHPPLYKQVPEGNQEILDAGEAFHLFDHLTSRYQTIEKTQLYHNFAHDTDFNLILLIGLQQTLEKQVNLFETESNSFGLPLIARPPKTVNTTEGKDIYNDETMYRDVFTGMQFMFELHATAMRQCTTNDRLRQIYIRILGEELQTIESWIKYGKIKGWLRPVPMYKV